MKLNLQKDARKLRSIIERRIKDYPVYVNHGPGADEDPITLITLGFYVFQTGYFAMVFDTRPDADSDGNWTLYLDSDSNFVDFPNWFAAYEELCDGGNVDVVLPDGNRRTLDESDDEESVAKLFGETILGTIRSIREENGFESLPLAPKAFFIIEEFDGTWAWPAYKKRKSLGRIRKP